MGPMLYTVKWVKNVSCGEVIVLAVEQPQLFRKLHKNKNRSLYIVGVEDYSIEYP